MASLRLSQELSASQLSCLFNSMLSYVHGAHISASSPPICIVGSQSASKTKGRLCGSRHQKASVMMPKQMMVINWSKWRPVFANSKADDPIPSEMSVENALQLLGVSEGASFDEILKAKKSLITRSIKDQDLLVQVEAAYDLLLMNSLTQRRSGKVADRSILYADVKNTKSILKNFVPEWFRGAFNKLPVVVEPPPANDLVIQSVVFASLIVLTYATALSSSVSEASTNIHTDVPGLPLAAGFGSCLYFLTKRNMKLGKAAVITVSSLVAGAIFGATIESWLRVDIIPLFGIGSPAVVVTEFVLLSLWLSSLYLH